MKLTREGCLAALARSQDGHRREFAEFFANLICADTMDHVHAIWESIPNLQGSSAPAGSSWRCCSSCRRGSPGPSLRELPHSPYSSGVAAFDPPLAEDTPSRNEQTGRDDDSRSAGSSGCRSARHAPPRRSAVAADDALRQLQDEMLFEAPVKKRFQYLVADRIEEPAHVEFEIPTASGRELPRPRNRGIQSLAPPAGIAVLAAGIENARHCMSQAQNVPSRRKVREACSPPDPPLHKRRLLLLVAVGLSLRSAFAPLSTHRRPAPCPLHRTARTRNPRKLYRSDGVLMPRRADRQYPALTSQPPPRTTRYEPVGGPVGSTCVGGEVG